MIPEAEGPGEVLDAVPRDGHADGVPGNVVAEMPKEGRLRGGKVEASCHTPFE